MGTIKDRNGKEPNRCRCQSDQEEMERIHRRTVQNDLDNHDGTVSHSELDVAEDEVKRALGSAADSKAVR